MKITNKKILELKPKQLQEWREYEKGSLLENGLALNLTALFIWKLCDGNTRVKSIADKLAKKYSINYKKAEQDTVECVSILHEEGGISL